MRTTFPAQALPCSGSTGIISAGSFHCQHPGELDSRFGGYGSKLIDFAGNL